MHTFKLICGVPEKEDQLGNENLNLLLNYKYFHNYYR